MGLVTIHRPEIVETSNGARLQAVFTVDGNEDLLWYEVEDAYKEYLTAERADAFLVGLFLLALKHNYNIEVLAPVSKRLYYTLNKYLLPLTGEIRGEPSIKVFCDYIIDDALPNAKAVGTGLSCGIDSLSTIYHHLVDDCPEDYKITHFTFFNVGANGGLGGEKARDLFKRRIELIKPCAQELGRDLITLDSNISEVLQLGFYETHTYRNLSATLALQKLFKVYYYSSSYSIKYFDLKPNSCGHYDIFNMSMLSTENLNFFSTCPHQTRVEKTRMVSDFKPAQKYLNVCTIDGRNCGRCEKCVRTLFTLEILGKLNDFSSIFNLENYYQNRNKYIAKVLAFYNTNEYMKEIYEEITNIQFRIPIYSKLASYYLKFRSKVLH